MSVPLEQFRENSARVGSLISLYKVLTQQVTPAVDLSDMLRAALVLAVSAVDHYVHEIVRIGMLDTSLGKRPSTPAFLRFQISMASVKEALSSSSGDWLDNEIRRQHGWQSFQRSSKVADAIRLISEIQLWDEVAMSIGTSAALVKEQLDLIASRRDKIAHEADMDPSSPGSRWPIDEALVRDAAEFLEKVVISIDNLMY